MYNNNNNNYYHKKKIFLDNMVYIYIGCNADVIQTMFRFE